MADVGLTLIAESMGVSIYVLGLILLWTLVWKGLALWKSARKSHMIWFIIILIVQTMGILEILYIFLFSELKLDQTRGVSKKRKVKKKK